MNWLKRMWRRLRRKRMVWVETPATIEDIIDYELAQWSEDHDPRRLDYQQVQNTPPSDDSWSL